MCVEEKWVSSARRKYPIHKGKGERNLGENLKKSEEEVDPFLIGNQSEKWICLNLSIDNILKLKQPKKILALR